MAEVESDLGTPREWGHVSILLCDLSVLEEVGRAFGWVSCCEISGTGKPCCSKERGLGRDPESLILCPALCLTPGLSPCPRCPGQWSRRASCPLGQWLWLMDKECWGGGHGVEGCGKWLAQWGVCNAIPG